jgi:hypothetical protein
MAVIIQLRRDTAANWTTVNPVLHDGELGIERDTGKAKLGDGSSAWSSLSYWQPTGADTDNYDVAGAAATAQTAAQTFATNAVATETTRAQSAEAALAPLAGAAFTGPVSVSQSSAAGGMLIVANAHTTPSSPSVQLMAAASGDQVLGAGTTGDAFPRVLMTSDGSIWFGNGAGAPDAQLFRNSAAQLRTTKLDIDSSQTAGQQFQVINRHAGSTTANTIFQSQQAGDPSTAVQVSGDTNPRLLIDSNGQMSWGSGAAGADVSISRIGAGQLQTNAMKMVNNSVAGNVLFVQNTHTTPTSPSVTLHAQTAADQTVGISVTGDAQQRLIVDSNGKMLWGDGTSSGDTNLYRASAGTLKTDGALQTGGTLNAASGSLVVSTTQSAFNVAASAGPGVKITNTQSAPTAPTFGLLAAAAGDGVMSATVTGDAHARMTVDSNGKILWGTGALGGDTNLYRASAGVLQTDTAIQATSYILANRFVNTGLTGATAQGRWVGTTVAGPPTAGTFLTGDFVNDQAGDFWTCVSGGSPGNWNAAGGNDWESTQQLTSGETVLPRTNIAGGTVLASGRVQFSYFTATKTEVCTQLGSLTNNTLAAPTPTVCQMGLYSVDASGNLTSVAITANDTAMWASTFTQYNKTVTSFTKQAGQRYAFAVLIVTAASAPNLFGYNGTIAYSGLAPVLCKAVSGQSSLLSSYAVGTLSGASAMYCGVVLP